MSGVIKNELVFFGISLLMGVVFLLGYDILRALRKALPHNHFWLAVEDFCYWTLAGITASYVIFTVNSGILRGFSLVAMIGGMVLYHKSISRVVVGGFARIFGGVIGIISWIIQVILFPILFLSKKMRKIVRKTLKNRLKEVKMIINKK